MNPAKCSFNYYRFFFYRFVPVGGLSVRIQIHSKCDLFPFIRRLTLPFRFFLSQNLIMHVASDYHVNQINANFHIARDLFAFQRNHWGIQIKNSCMTRNGTFAWRNFTGSLPLPDH